MPRACPLAQNALEPRPRHRPIRVIPLEQTREVRALRQVMWVGLRLGESGEQQGVGGRDLLVKPVEGRSPRTPEAAGSRVSRPPRPVSAGSVSSRPPAIVSAPAEDQNFADAVQPAH